MGGAVGQTTLAAVSLLFTSAINVFIYSQGGFESSILWVSFNHILMGFFFGALAAVK